MGNQDGGGGTEKEVATVTQKVQRAKVTQSLPNVLEKVESESKVKLSLPHSLKVTGCWGLLCLGTFFYHEEAGLDNHWMASFSIDFGCF